MDFLLRFRLWLLFAGLLLLGLWFMQSDRAGAAAVGGDSQTPWLQSALLSVAEPVQKAAALPGNWFHNLREGAAALLNVREENAALRARTAALEEENLQLREALVASGHLTRIAKMREGFEAPLLPAEVIGWDVALGLHSVFLDQGRRDRVRAGMPVITAQGLAGLVTKTAPGQARAMLLLDPNSAVDAIIQRSRARGSIRGAGAGGALRFEFLTRLRPGDVQAGDVVISSGFGGVYPKGIRIGVVSKLAAASDGAPRHAPVQPAVEFGRLEHVFVMLKRSPTLNILFGAGNMVGDDEGASAGAAR